MVLGLTIAQLTILHVVISLVGIVTGLVALSGFGRAGRAAIVYALTATIAQWLNMFVLVVQCFLKVHALKALAPVGNEPPFLVAQVVVRGAMVILGWALVRARRDPGMKAA